MTGRKGPSPVWARKKKPNGGPSMNRNPSGLIIPMEYRDAVKTEVKQAVRDWYPPGKDLVWNLTIIDQITDNPVAYPVTNMVLSESNPDRHRQIISNILNLMGFESDKGSNGRRSPYFHKPLGFDDTTTAENNLVPAGAPV